MTDLLARIETHIALKDASPGFHLSDNDLTIIASALKANAETRPIESAGSTPPAVFSDPPQSEAGAVAYLYDVIDHVTGEVSRHFSVSKPVGNSYQRNITPLYASPTPASGMVVVPTRDSVIEECAKVAESPMFANLDRVSVTPGPSWTPETGAAELMNSHARRIASAIRSLSALPQAVVRGEEDDIQK